MLAIPDRRIDVTKVPVSVSAGSAQREYPATNALDGNPGTFWVSGGSSPENPVSQTSPEYLTLTFDKNISADGIMIIARSGYGPKACELSYSGDGGKTWTPLAEIHCKNEAETKTTFQRTEADRFRLKITDSYDPNYPDKPIFL